mgnify:CR=1 FL=1
MRGQPFKVGLFFILNQNYQGSNMELLAFVFTFKSCFI